MKLLLMCDGQVGSNIAQWLLDRHPGDIGAMVTVNENAVYVDARAKGIPCFLYESDAQLVAALMPLPRCDLGILAWWPKLVSPQMLDLPEQGFVNTHPSLLPYNRGKHYNFWALVEQAPFGVSLHYVDQGIDSGDVIAQLPISYDWEDNGETLYRKAGAAMFELFKACYHQLSAKTLPRLKQDLTQGSLHYAREIEAASRIDLDKSYTARDLLNLLRARTFSGYPACWFEADGTAYEISVKIKRKSV